MQRQRETERDHGYRPETDRFISAKIGRVSQEEQNGTNFSLLAPSSEVL